MKITNGSENTILLSYNSKVIKVKPYSTVEDIHLSDESSATELFKSMNQMKSFIGITPESDDSDIIKSLGTKMQIFDSLELAEEKLLSNVSNENEKTKKTVTKKVKLIREDKEGNQTELDEEVEIEVEVEDSSIETDFSSSSDSNEDTNVSVEIDDNNETDSSSNDINANVSAS